MKELLKKEGRENASRPTSSNGRRLYAVAPDGTVVVSRHWREIARAAQAYAREYRRA